MAKFVCMFVLVTCFNIAVQGPGRKPGPSTKFRRTSNKADDILMALYRNFNPGSRIAAFVTAVENEARTTIEITDAFASSIETMGTDAKDEFKGRFADAHGSLCKTVDDLRETLFLNKTPTKTDIYSAVASVVKLADAMSQWVWIESDHIDAFVKAFDEFVSRADDILKNLQNAAGIDDFAFPAPGTAGVGSKRPRVATGHNLHAAGTSGADVGSKNNLHAAGGSGAIGGSLEPAGHRKRRLH